MSWFRIIIIHIYSGRYLKVKKEARQKFKGNIRMANMPRDGWLCHDG